METSAMETLALIGHFRESDEGKLKQVEAQFAVEEFRKGEMLYRAHDKPDHIFFLDKGAIVLLAEDHDGLVLELERITARGSVIGDEILSSEAKKTRLCSAVSDVDSRVLSLSKAGWKKVAKVLKAEAKRIQRDAEQRATLQRIARNASFFQSMSKYNAHQFMSICGVKRYEPNQVILRQREMKHNQSFYVIVSGSARVLVGRSVAGDLGFGEHFGEISLIRGKPRSATVMAVGDSDCVCLKIRKRFFKRLIATEPKLHAEFHLKEKGIDAELEHIIRHDIGRKYCLNFADERYMRECMDFWLAVEDFQAVKTRVDNAMLLVNEWHTEKQVKTAESKLLKEGAQRIAEKWVLKGAPQEVPTSEDIQQRVAATYEKGDFSFHMFQEAKVYVINLLADNFYGFKDSTHFRDLLDEVPTYEFEDD